MTSGTCRSTRRVVAGLVGAFSLGLVAAAVTFAQADAVSDRDQAFALRHLLGIKAAPTAKPASRTYDALAEYHEWSALYDRVHAQADHGSEDALRMYLFFGF